MIKILSTTALVVIVAGCGRYTEVYNPCPPPYDGRTHTVYDASNNTYSESCAMVKGGEVHFFKLEGGKYEN